MSRGRIAKARAQYLRPILVPGPSTPQAHKDLVLTSFFFATGSDTSHSPRIKTTVTFKSGMGKCNLKKSQEKLEEGFNNALSGTAGPKQPNLIQGNLMEIVMTEWKRTLGNSLCPGCKSSSYLPQSNHTSYMELN